MPFEVEYRSLDDIEKTIEREEAALETDSSRPTSALWLAYMDLWNAIGSAGLPDDKVQAHREQYFKDMKFMSIKDIVDRGRVLQGSDDVL